MTQLHTIANLKYANNNDWIFGIEDSDNFKVKTFFKKFPKDENIKYLTLGKVISVNNNEIKVKIAKDNGKFIIITLPNKLYWVLDETKLAPSELVDVDNFSIKNKNIGGKMKITKSELFSFAESLTDALETVAEKIEAIEEIINGDVEVNEDVEDEVEIEDEVNVEEEDADSDSGSDNEVEIEDEDEDDDIDEDEDEEELSNEQFSKRYTDIKNFLTM